MKTDNLRSRLPLRIVFTLFAFLSFVSLAQAQSANPVGSPGQFTVTPFGGLAFSGDLDGTTGTFGVAGGYVLSNEFALEAEFSTIPSSELSGAVEVDNQSWNLTANLLYRLRSRERFAPYIVGGFGYGHSSIDDVDDDNPTVENESNRLIATFGAGAERTLSQNLAFRGDFRYFFGGNLVPDYWRFSVGLTFAFGGR